MDLNQIKPKQGERYIIVENGEAIAVLISFEEYQKIFEDQRLEDKRLEDLEKDKMKSIFTNTMTSKLASTEDMVDKKKDQNKKELTVEDLPF